LLALVAGCGGVAGPRAEVSSPTNEPLAEETCSGERYDFDDQGSHIEVVGAALGGTDRIVIHDFEGQMRRRDGRVSIRLHADMRSMQADDPDVDEFIKSPAYFDVERLPDMRFTSEEPSKRRGAEHVVRGKLLLHGSTKTIAFPVIVRREGDRLTLKSHFVIDRHDFDIHASALVDVLISNDLLIDIELGGHRVNTACREAETHTSLAPAE
jgi:polyisoprenoid-binding protein YceI